MCFAYPEINRRYTDTMNNDTLSKAIFYHKKGDFLQAKAKYQAVLRDEDLPHVHFLLGTVLMDEKSYQAADEHLSMAVLSDSLNKDYLALLADAKLKLGDKETALSLAEYALGMDPKHPIACTVVAEILCLEGKINEAITQLNVILVSPDKPLRAYFILAKCLERQSRWEDLSHYIDLLAKSFGDEPETLEMIANYFLQTGELTKAYDILIDLNQNLGTSKRAISLLAKYYAQKGSFDNACSYYRAAWMRDVNDIALLREFNDVLRKAQAWNKSEALLKEAVELVDEKNKFEVKKTLVYPLMKNASRQDNYSFAEGMQIAQEVLEQNPEGVQENFNLANLYMEMAMPEKAMPYFDKGLKRDGYNPNSESSSIFNSLYLEDMTPAQYKQRIDTWSEKYERPLADHTFTFEANPDPDKRLRIGFVSPDLGLHPVGYFLKQIFPLFDQEQFKIHCYLSQNLHDEFSIFFEKHSSVWRNVTDLNHEQLSKTIHEDGIDILIDLAGHSSGNRLLSFGHRPAPIQMSWLGFAGSTGLKSIDYRLTDRITEPPEFQAYSSEKLLYLPNGFHCYRPQYGFPEVSASPCEKNGFVTFGSYNNFCKVSPTTMELWSRILETVPNSQLQIKGRHLRCKEAREQFHEFFTSKGVDLNRIKVLPFFTSNYEHLESYSGVDIALDTTPYNGTTTTCEAMYMGVPVIALLGNAHVSRVSASLLTQVGLTDFIAKSLDEYVAIAAQKAANTEELVKRRKTLREQMKASPLYNAEQFTNNLQNTFREVWQKYCHDLA